MSELWIRDTGEFIKADEYALRERGVPADWRQATPAERHLIDRIGALERSLETIEIVADNEAMDATDVHYAIILSGIKATARDARASAKQSSEAPPNRPTP